MINVYNYKALIREYPPDQYSFVVSPPHWIPNEYGLSDGSNAYYMISGVGRGLEDKLVVNVERVKLYEL
jgi:hypothetical protein